MLGNGERQIDWLSSQFTSRVNPVETGVNVMRISTGGSGIDVATGRRDQCSESEMLLTLWYQFLSQSMVEFAGDTCV